MEKLFRHIEHLLIRNDYVIVPGFGGFVIQNQSARILDGKIIPPLSTVGFNSLLMHEDGMLAIEISRVDGTSYREAVTFINEQIHLIEESMRNGNTVGVGRLGSLCLIDNNIIFTPESDLSFIPSNYCLSPIAADEYKLAKIKQKQTKQHVQFKNRKNYAAAVAIILCLLFVPVQLFDTKRQEANIFNVSTVENKIQEQQPVAELELSTEQEVEQTGNDVELARQEPVAAVIQTPEASKDFCVIVGCFQGTAKAEILLQRLIEDDFPGAEIIASSKNYKVSIAAFENKDEAIAFLRQVRDTEYPKAWMMKR